MNYINDIDIDADEDSKSAQPKVTLVVRTSEGITLEIGLGYPDDTAMLLQASVMLGDKSGISPILYAIVPDNLKHLIEGV